MGVLQTTVVGDLCFNNLRGSNIFRDKGIVFVSRCYKSGLLKVIGQFSYDGTGCTTPVEFVGSHWLQVLVSFNPSMDSRQVLFNPNCKTLKTLFVLEKIVHLWQ